MDKKPTAAADNILAGRHCKGSSTRRTYRALWVYRIAVVEVDNVVPEVGLRMLCPRTSIF